VAGLAHEVGHVGKTGGQLGAAAGHADRLLQDGQDALAVEVEQVLFVDDLAHQRNETVDVGGGVVHHRVEIRQDLENLPEVLVQLVQHVVELAVPDHDDLDVDVDGLGREVERREQRVRIEALDGHLVVLEGPLHVLVHLGLHQGVARVEHEIAAVGPQEGAGPDLHEIRPDGAGALDALLDGAEDVPVAGHGLDDDGGAGEVGVVDDHVDHVRQVRVAGFLRRGEEAQDVRLVLLLLLEDLDPVEDVGLHVGQEFFHLVPGEAGADLADDLVDERLDRAADQAALGLDDLLLQRLELLAQLAHLLRQFLVHGLDPLEFGGGVLFLVGLLLQLGHGHGLVVDDRHQLGALDGAVLDLDQREAAFVHLFLKAADQLFLAGVGALHQPVQLLLELVALEDLRHVLQAVFHQPAHLLFQQLAVAGRQVEAARGIGVAEVVDVAQVVRDPAGAVDLGQQRLDGGHLAGARQTGDEDVVADALHLQAQPDGPERPFLADDGGAGGLVLGGVPRELVAVEPETEGVGTDAQLIFDGHAELLGECWRRDSSPRGEPARRRPS